MASYTSPEGPEGSHGNGKGIYGFEMDPATGALQPRQTVPEGDNPSWLALHPSKRFLFAANETNSYKGTPSGSVTAFAIENATGNLQALNTVSSQGRGPAYVSVHPSGKYAFVANYAGGTVAVLPIEPDGRLREAVDVKQDSGTVGPKNASSAPPGSFAISGHDRPHAHMVLSDPAGRFVFWADLGLDQILIWKLDVSTGKLTRNGQPFISLPPGDGPRHFVFHPNQRWLYSLQEEGSTLVRFDYQQSDGNLRAQGTVSSLPKGFAGTNFTSEVVISPDARFLYAANRLHDTIACFSIGSSGNLQFVAEEPTRGDYPRSFSIDPTGQYLYSCNQRSDALTSFRIERHTGKLTFTGDYIPVGTPAMILFVS